MDIFDEVLSLEEKAYKEGYEIGEGIARETSQKQSHLEGFEHGRKVSKEVAFIKSYAKYVGENISTERIRKVVNNIEILEISPDMPIVDIQLKLQTLTAMYKNLLSLLRIKGNVSTSNDIY